MEPTPMKKYVAECFGTFVLTFFGCGSAAILGSTLGTLGIAFAFGLSIVAMAYVIGDISGCHINPAVSLGLFLDNRLSGTDLAGYIIAQFIGGFIAALALWLIISCCGIYYPFGVLETGLGCNGFDAASSVGINLGGALLIEVILTCIFVLVVLGATASEKIAPFAGLIIGLALTFVHIMGIPNTGTSVNPARSFGPALVMAFNGDPVPLMQVWVFIVAPALGAVLAAFIWRYFKDRADDDYGEAAPEPVYGVPAPGAYGEQPPIYPGQPVGAYPMNAGAPAWQPMPQEGVPQAMPQEGAPQPFEAQPMAAQPFEPQPGYGPQAAPDAGVAGAPWPADAAVYGQPGAAMPPTGAPMPNPGETVTYDGESPQNPGNPY